MHCLPLLMISWDIQVWHNIDKILRRNLILVLKAMISWWLVSYFAIFPLCRHLDHNEIIQVPNNVFKNLARLEFLWVYKLLVYKYIVRAIQQIHTSVLTDVGSVAFVSAYLLLMSGMHSTSYLTLDESDEIWSPSQHQWTKHWSLGD